ncbi:GNAT family N-acetyltransferase [Halobacillus locisalis]|uniref:GNAT family N-acetyltransferase n=1 Tax=Halobacillus locisalis TaxID=220753 RepID=A0A838CPB7_9BACI|nr:GNAT family N-acetyltransferase [Halobacillus locisalis]MBA2173781.1 GNAT family N-acetyltransferase [Halobacillus locisalis]
MNPITKNIRTSLETERCLLRAPQSGDGEQINKAIKRSLAELSPWLAFARQHPSVEDTETNTRQAASKFITRENLRYLIFSKETGAFIGSTGFHEIDWSVPKLEIGYWIDTKHSGNGYMLEAVEALTTFAFEELDMVRIEIQCESENVRSRAIPEKLGFQMEGIMRNDDRSVDGKRLTDTCIYSKVKVDKF